MRSEEVQEILTRPPHALVRWGITVFFVVLALFFIGGCFFKYPDVISASITITTEHPPIWMVARGSGKIKEVYHKDRDSVWTGNIIAVLENPAVTEDVLRLKEQLASFNPADQQRLHRAVPWRSCPGKHTERLRLFPEKPDGLPQLPLTESVRTEGGGHPPGVAGIPQLHRPPEQTSRTGQGTSADSFYRTQPREATF